MERSLKVKRILGWIAVAISALFAAVWAYWGTIENFHEGWYSPSLLDNLGMLFFQYWSVPIAYMLLAVLSLSWPKIGLLLHAVLAGFSAWFFRGASFLVAGLMIAMPVLGLGLLYFFGRPDPKKWAYRAVVAVPLLVMVTIAPFRLAQVSQRVCDGDFGQRVVAGNGITLAWAPRGPGWPDGGLTYEEALNRCRHLSADGMTLMETEQNIWRLPAVDEAVRSMALHGTNAGGIWNPVTKSTSYQVNPDKETPLWDTYSPVIYYWVGGDTGNDKTAFIIVYHGGVFTRNKESQYAYLSFRAVKEADQSHLGGH